MKAGLHECSTNLRRAPELHRDVDDSTFVFHFLFALKFGVFRIQKDQDSVALLEQEQQTTNVKNRLRFIQVSDEHLGPFISVWKLKRIRSSRSV